MITACRPIVALLLATSVGSVAGAQSATGNVGSTAIVDLALSGTAVRDLDFGQLTPASAQTVSPSDVPGCVPCASGKWIFSNLIGTGAPATRFAQLTFTVLPSELIGPGGATLPLAWTNAARACLQKGAAEYHCYADWTPAQGMPQSHPVNGPGAPPTPAGSGSRSMNVYLGGTAQPPASQRAGVYFGTVTLQFAYGSS